MSNQDDEPARSASDSPSGALPAREMRISDADRNAAIKALGEHLAAGRITLDEYGDRTAKVTLTRTAGELGALFDDLPAPHPTLSVTPAGDAPLAHPAPTGALMPPARGQVAATEDTRSTAQKLVGAAAASSVFVAIVLFFITDSWYWFLLIPAISAIAGSIWGPDWKDPNGGAREARRQLRRDLRDGRWDPDD